MAEQQQYSRQAKAECSFKFQTLNMANGRAETLKKKGQKGIFGAKKKKAET